MHIVIEPTNERTESLYAEKYGTKGTVSEGNAGFDLIMPETITVPAKTYSVLLDLKIRVHLEEHCDIRPRSSMGSKTPLRLANSVGTIDKSYRNNWKVCVDNVSAKDYTIKRGDRLVQVTCWDSQARISYTFGRIPEADTGREGGFGSTGR